MGGDIKGMIEKCSVYCCTYVVLPACQKKGKTSFINTIFLIHTAFVFTKKTGPIMITFKIGDVFLLSVSNENYKPIRFSYVISKRPS